MKGCSGTIGWPIDVERMPIMFDARMTRRSVVALCATLLLTGCGAGEPAAAGSTGSAQDAPAAASKNVAWEAKLDAEPPS